LSILWPLKKSLRPSGEGGRALLLPIVIWPVVRRIEIAEAAINILSAEKKMVKRDERARRKRRIRAVR
jgi:hypothetical protein